MSLPEDYKNIIKDIQECEKQYFKEITLTGVNICQYNDNGDDLSTLLNDVLTQTNITRIRLGSLDPRLITKELVTLYNENKDRLLPHFHLSLQSGSDTVLKAMSRGYTAKTYKDIIKYARAQNPLFSITTDIIVGFPTEDDIEFQKTVAFVRKIQFTDVHIFPFSPRPETKACELTPVHNQTVTDRAKKLKDVVKKSGEKYIQHFIGKELPILFEHQKSGTWYGYSPQYFRVKHKSKQNLANVIKNIVIDKHNIC